MISLYITRPITTQRYEMELQMTEESIRDMTVEELLSGLDKSYEGLKEEAVRFFLEYIRKREEREK